MRDAQGAIGLMTLLTDGEREEEKRKKEKEGEKGASEGSDYNKFSAISFFSHSFFFSRSRDNDQRRIPGNWLAGDIASGLLTC